MEIIVAKRGEGKTTELVKRSAEDKIYILAVDRKRALQLVNVAKKMRVCIPFPITVDEFLGKRSFYGSIIRRDGILIDDVDIVLQRIFAPLEIKAVTVTERKITRLSRKEED